MIAPSTTRRRRGKWSIRRCIQSTVVIGSHETGMQRLRWTRDGAFKETEAWLGWLLFAIVETWREETTGRRHENGSIVVHGHD